MFGDCIVQDGWPSFGVDDISVNREGEYPSRLPSSRTGMTSGTVHRPSTSGMTSISLRSVPRVGTGFADSSAVRFVLYVSQTSPGRYGSWGTLPPAQSANSSRVGKMAKKEGLSIGNW